MAHKYFITPEINSGISFIMTSISIIKTRERPQSVEHYISFHNQADVIGSIIRKKNGVWIDPKQEAIQNSQNHLLRYTKSCEASDGPSCTAVGMRYGMGLEVEQSDSLALKYFMKACKLDDANGCHYLADIYTQGKGIQKDVGIDFKYTKVQHKSILTTTVI